MLKEPVLHRVAALFGLGLQHFRSDGLFAHLVKSGRHASWGSGGHDDQPDDGHGQANRVTHGSNNTDAGDEEPDNPDDPSSERVGEGQFEAATDEVDVLLVHGHGKWRPMITLLEVTEEILLSRRLSVLRHLSD